MLCWEQRKREIQRFLLLCGIVLALRTLPFSREYKMIRCCSLTSVMCFILSLSCGWMTLNCKQMWTDICVTLYSGQTWEDTSEHRKTSWTQLTAAFQLICGLYCLHLKGRKRGGKETYSSFSVDLWSVLLTVYIWKGGKKLTAVFQLICGLYC